ncbi:carboxylesterase [Ahrensia sp. R2A130]|uniref:alpha/beta hydrolase n=1 Tax=Ahrensia sp. R2A130 TaxID=744979 RepID=UPI0001E0F87F|nr:alpha/beta hydrolase [Ahrensia sp. R2A130]EFL89204.1 2-hydroxymuconic semialdehyde hydrolase [Ahrensia sp. R2A130]
MSETDERLTHEWASGETVELAIKRQSHTNDNPTSPGFVWLGGFKSDMAGTKADVMVQTAMEIGAPSLRFDYSGHGTSGGKFTDGTISRWVDESLAVLRAKTDGPQILVGSSMGGWIALRLMQRLQEIGETHRVAALLLIAPAPDFTTELMEPAFSDAQREALVRDGFFEEPTEYSDEPNVITRALIEDGRNNLTLVPGLKIGCSIRILQGMADPDVPHTHALRLVEHLADDDVTMTLVKDGDHRLSREVDLALLARTMEQLHAVITGDLFRVQSDAPVPLAGSGS